METTIISQPRETNLVNLISIVRTLSALAMKPVGVLSAYYSSVVGRSVSTRQTLHLLHVQVAFAVAVLPAESPLLLRTAALAWLVQSLCACRRAMGSASQQE